MGFFEKIKNGLKKTRSAMAATLGGLFDSFTGANEEFYEELEESMILADMGVETSCKAVELLRQRVKEEKLRGGEEIRERGIAAYWEAHRAMPHYLPYKRD